MEYLKKAAVRDSEIHRDLERTVRNMIENVCDRGDEALIEYNTQFDGNTRGSLKVSGEEIERAYELTPQSLVDNLRLVSTRLKQFAQRQKETLTGFEDCQLSPGIHIGQRILPVNSCCCYIPGGGYPLYSTALMMGITARAAGVGRIAMCTPAVNGTESVHPSTLVAMDLAGIKEIYAVGGAHAIAAFAYGTEQIASVDLIVGPGNQYVTEAKRQCFGKIGIDFLAGPSEILIIADGDAEPAIIAADLLSESEHDPMAIARLVTDSRVLGEAVMKQMEKRLTSQETEDIAAASWEKQGEVLVLDSLEDACHYANQMAPEHLVLQVKEPQRYKKMLQNYGTLFLGKYSAVVYSDYVNGINHTLPTGGASKYTGGLWIGTFSKVCTTQTLTQEGAHSVAALAAELADGEGFPGHAEAARIRLK